MENKETKFVDDCVIHFSKHFKCQREVWSKCKQGRIDIVLETSCGKFFGIEAKVPERKRGEEIGNYIQQAMRYSTYEFEVKPNQFQRIPIFICPPISYKYFIMNNEEQIIDGIKWHRDRHNENFEHHSFNGFLGTFNVGEVRKVQQGAFALIHSNKTIFSTKIEPIYDGRNLIGRKIQGLHEKNYELLIQKISRL